MEKRNAYFDNIKFLLIILVVLGHFFQNSGDAKVVLALKNVIYSFHMPLFIFISGYFSKNIQKHRKKELDTVLFAYFVFEILNLAYTKITSFGLGNSNLFVPTYQNWYLLALFFWRMMAPYYGFYRKLGAIAFSILLAFSIGFFRGFNDFLAIYRTLYFMPFFLVGYFWGDVSQTVQKLAKYRVFFISLLMLLLAGVFAISIKGFGAQVNYAFTPRLGYNGANLANFAYRAMGFLVTSVISFLFLFVVPTKKTLFTKYGRNTLSVFLMHQFFVWPVCWFLKRMDIGSYGVIIAGIVFSVELSLFLSLDKINNIVSFVTNFERIKDWAVRLLGRKEGGKA